MSRIRKPAWRSSELRVLREHYPTGGAAACTPHIKRSLNAISIKARSLGLNAPPAEGWRPALQLTPEQEALVDEAVRRSPVSSLTCSQLAARAGMTFVPFKRRVQERGGQVLPPAVPRRPWTAAEDEFLREYSDRNPLLMQRLLREHLKSRRSTGSIHNRRVELGLTHHIDRGGYTARELARSLGVTHSRVARWVRSGKLTAHRYRRGDPHRGVGGKNVSWVVSAPAVRRMLEADLELLASVRRTAVRVWLRDVLGELQEIRQDRSGFDGAEDAMVWLEAA